MIDCLQAEVTTHVVFPLRGLRCWPGIRFHSDLDDCLFWTVIAAGSSSSYRPETTDQWCQQQGQELDQSQHWEVEGKLCLVGRSGAPYK